MAAILAAEGIRKHHSDKKLLTDVTLYIQPGDKIGVVGINGTGKTTLLRDLIRIASESGWNVAVADERCEIAACWDGAPQMDVGPRTDVMDGCPKALALPMLIRSCAPQLLAVDEIGDPADAAALLEARRCGAELLATAHAPGFEDARRRGNLRDMLNAGAFDWLILLGAPPGRIVSIHDCLSGEEIEC